MCKRTHKLRFSMRCIGQRQEGQKADQEKVWDLSLVLRVRSVIIGVPNLGMFINTQSRPEEFVPGVARVRWNADSPNKKVLRLARGHRNKRLEIKRFF
jgi:hypothetical protein